MSTTLNRPTATAPTRTQGRDVPPRRRISPWAILACAVLAVLGQALTIYGAMYALPAVAVGSVMTIGSVAFVVVRVWGRRGEATNHAVLHNSKDVR